MSDVVFVRALVIYIVDLRGLPLSYEFLHDESLPRRRLSLRSMHTRDCEPPT